MQNPYLPELNKNLAVHYESGVYTEFNDINSILNIHFKFYNEKLVQEVQKFDSLDLIKRTLELIERLQWEERTDEVIQQEEALILIIERCLENYYLGTQIPDYESFDNIYCLALECLKIVYSCNSNALFKECAKVNLDTSDNRLGIGSINPKIEELGAWFSKRNEQNITLRSFFSNEIQLTEKCQQKLEEELDPEFRKVFGASLSDAINLLLGFSDSPFRSSSFTILEYSEILENARNSYIESNQILPLLEGFSLSPETKNRQPRDPWNHKQKDRLRKKPLIKISFEDKTFFIFSSTLLVTRLYEISEDIILRPDNRIPDQWNFPTISRAFTTAREFVGKVWFENIVKNLMEQVNVIGFQPTYPRINKLGPLDFLGISVDSKSLIILECKLLDQEFGAKGFRNQLDSFDKIEGYIPKFQKKINWCTDNIEFVKKDFKKRYPEVDTSQISVINFCIVTYYPTLIDFLERDVAVPTIFELVNRFKKLNRWPLKKGIIKLP